MESDKKRPDLLFLLKAGAIWLITAAALLLLSAGIISAMNLSSSSVAYFSAGISFLSAFGAAFAACTGKSGKWKCGLLTGLVLTVFLLMLGFIAVGSELSADGVLSVTSFTLAGALAGGIFAPASQRNLGRPRNRNRPVIRPKRNKTQ